MEVSGKINWLSRGDIATDTKTINRSPILNKVANALRVNSTTNKNPYMLEASQVQPGSDLFDQVSGNPA